jgi:hypothetical protein
LHLSVADRNLTLTEPVLRYCAKHQLLPHVETAIRLAETHFHPVHELCVGVEEDPEIEDDYLVIDVSVAMGSDEVLRRYDAYTLAWIDSAPQEKREKICMLYHIL